MDSVDFTYEDILIELSHEGIREIYDGNLDVNQPDVLGDYLLNLSCEHLQVENVAFFISKGADIERTHHLSSDTPILLAIDYVNHNPEAALRIVEMLLNHGANIEHRGYMDKTPFLKACTRVNMDMIKLLVSRGCNVKAATEDFPGNKNDGLFFADVMNGSKDVKEYLKTVIC